MLRRIIFVLSGGALILCLLITCLAFAQTSWKQVAYNSVNGHVVWLEPNSFRGRGASAVIVNAPLGPKGLHYYEYTLNKIWGYQIYADSRLIPSTSQVTRAILPGLEVSSGRGFLVFRDGVPIRTSGPIPERRVLPPPPVFYNFTSIFVSYWWLICLTGTLSLPFPFQIIQSVRRRGRIRAAVRDRHCHVCGYDLRASKSRCPECGTKILA